MEDVLLQENDLEKFTRIGTGIKEKAREDFIQFLRKSIDVFAWSHDDMPGIDLSVITHRLNVYPFLSLFARRRGYSLRSEIRQSRKSFRN